MNKILTSQIRLDLLRSHKTERDKRIADRIKSVLLYDDGLTPPKIAKVLFIDEDTVRSYIKSYQEEDRLTPNHKGSQPLLSVEESQMLSEHLESTIYVKIKDIQTYVREHFHKHLGISTLYKWLKSHGFSYKKPKLVPKGADPVAQEEFKVLYEKIMNEAALEGDPVVFGDSVHPSQQVRVSYGWIKVGKDMPIETTSARKRINIMGALNLETMNFIYQDFETINGLSATDFLKKLETIYPKASKIHLIWDQAGYHTCMEVKTYLENKNCRVKVYYLPPRSPNLNPIERLWKIMHEYVSNNQTYEKFKDFKKSLFAFFDCTMKSILDVLLTRITDNFQILNPAKS